MHDPKQVFSIFQAKKLLGELGLRPRKGLGQHFLVDGRVLGQTVKAAELSPQDTIIEVGPGLGILTRALAEKAKKVIAVELDRQLALSLSLSFSPFPNVRVIQGDILDLNPLELVDESQYKVVANIPYYITSPILRHFLESRFKPRLMVIMVQREVAEAIIAKPGELSLLAISVQLYSQPRIVDYVPKEGFYPRPKVESAILRLDMRDELPLEVDPENFLQFVAMGFSAPRKQLHNSLAQGLGLKPADVALKLKEIGIVPQRRPQHLALEEWARLWQAFKN